MNIYQYLDGYIRALSRRHRRIFKSTRLFIVSKNNHISSFVTPLLTLLALVSGAWAVVVIAAPVMPGWFAAIVYALAGKVCHQLPGRSFHFEGHQLAVCARCTGIYAAAAAVFGWLSVRTSVLRDPLPMTPRGAVSWLGAGVLPTLVTLGVEVLDVAPATNAVRAVAGVVLGGAVAFVVGRAVTLPRHAPNASTLPR